MPAHEDLVAQERASFQRAADWELKQIVTALNMMPWLNSPADTARMVAVKQIQAERRARKRKA
jgi:hypothetical protein